MKNVPIKVDRLETFFKDKEIKSITQDVIKKQLEHLHAENFLFKLSDNENEISELGKQEIKEVKKAIEKI